VPALICRIRGLGQRAVRATRSSSHPSRLPRCGAFFQTQRRVVSESQLSCEASAAGALPGCDTGPFRPLACNAVSHRAVCRAFSVAARNSGRRPAPLQYQCSAGGPAPWALPCRRFEVPGRRQPDSQLQARPAAMVPRSRLHSAAAIPQILRFSPVSVGQCAVGRSVDVMCALRVSTWRPASWVHLARRTGEHRAPSTRPPADSRGRTARRALAFSPLRGGTGKQWRSVPACL